MRNRQLPFVLIASSLIWLMPLQAFAVVCIGIAPFGETLVVETAASLGLSGAFNSLAGQHLNVCGDGTASPLNGNSYLQSPAGTTSFGTITHADRPGDPTVGCAPVSIEGTLNGTIDPPVNPDDPPQFTGGSGFLRNLFGGSAALTFFNVACPSAASQPQSSGATSHTGTLQP